MAWFMLAMIAYPEKQKKCQEELDRVIGPARVPDFEDRDNVSATVHGSRASPPVRPIQTYEFWYTTE